MTAICESGVLGCQVIKGGMSKEEFLAFIYKLGNFYEFNKSRKKIIIFLDNATAHKAKLVTSNLEQKITLIYNASYSPMLNPIEEFFSKFKNLIKKLPTSTDFELLESIQLSLNMFKTKDFEGFMRHTLSFIPDVLNFIDFI